MIVDNKEHRFAYRLGFNSVRFGDVTKDAFLDNPYDFDLEIELFSYWQLGFEDGYQEEMELINIIDQP